MGLLKRKILASQRMEVKFVLSVWEKKKERGYWDFEFDYFFLMKSREVVLYII